MSRAQSAQRVPLLLLALVCTVLIGWSSMRAGSLIVQARASQLNNAERAVVQAVAPLIQQDRISARLVRAVQGLIDARTVDLDFVTVRNANDKTLVSRGRLGENGLAWLPLANGRTWRSSLYRARSAQLARPIQQAGQRLGSARFGVTWTSIVYRAGMPLFVWATALVAGIMGLFGLVMRWSAMAAEPAGTRAGRPRPATPAASSAQPVSATQSGKRASLSGILRRKRHVPSGFEPIGTRGDNAPTPTSDPVKRLSSSGQTRAPDDPPPDPPRSAQTSAPAAAASSGSNDAPSEATVRDAANAASSVAPTPFAPSSPVERAEQPADERSAVALEAPRIDAVPTLGDTTLDLRFYPIWRGEEQRRVLAGACAALAWRTGESELVDADTLTRLAEQDGALRAFTQWIARRFSLLHANWRTLELHTVPIVLPIPSAMLAFAGAEAVWRDALRHTDRDPNDLILRLDRPGATAAQTALPLRHALTAPADPAAALPSDCDVLCASPQHINDNAAAWCERFDDLQCPVLFGPISQPGMYTQVLGHERVMWFSDQPQAIHSPRSFARLLARNRTAPI